MNRIYRLSSHVPEADEAHVIDLPRTRIIEAIILDTRGVSGRVKIVDGVDLLCDLPASLFRALWIPLQMDTNRLNRPQMVMLNFPVGVQYDVYIAERK